MQIDRSNVNNQASIQTFVNTGIDFYEEEGCRMDLSAPPEIITCNAIYISQHVRYDIVEIIARDIIQ